MAENKDLNREIDKRVKIIDNKLKDAFSLIKKDIQDIKSNSNKTSKVDTSHIEQKIEQLKKEISQRPSHITNSAGNYKEVEKLKLQLLELKKEQQLKEKIESEKQKQAKLEHKLALKKQEANLLEKKSKELVNIIEQSNKNFTSNLKELQRQQEILIRQSKEQQEKILQETTEKQEQLRELYEAKIEELKVQHSFDKAKTEAKYSEDLIKYSQEQDALKQEIYDLGKQLDKIQSKKQYSSSTSTSPGFWFSLFSSFSSTSTKSKPVVKEVREEKKQVVKISKDTSKRNAFILKALVILIPLVLLGYVFYANFLASHEFNYFYDVGSVEDSKKPYLTPLNRVSDIINDSDNSYRNLTSNLVYFEVPVPIGANSIDIQSKILNTNSESNIMIGAKNKQDWSYYQKTAYSSFLESLDSPIYSDTNITIWKTNSEAKDIISISEIENGARVATDLPLKLQQTDTTYEIQNSTINTVLRGGHTFYVYLKDSLDLYVEKRDLNWYNGTDEMNVSLYDLEGNLLGNTMLSDDGFSLTERKSNTTVSGNLNVQNLNSGVYKLVFSDADVLITQIKINTDKIVTNKIFLGNANTYTQQGDKETTIFSSSTKDTVLRFNTYHAPYSQNITIGNKVLEIKSANSNSPFNLSSGSYYITSPKSNVIVSSSSFLTFSEKNYFEPFKYTITSIPTSSADLSGIDYIISGYKPTVKERNWIITNTQFNIEDLYTQNNKLSLLFNVPALSGESNSTGQVGVDWINITVNKNGFSIKGI